MSTVAARSGLGPSGALPSTRPRLATIDILRGFVMVIMPLDHTREFFTNVTANPLDPQQTTVFLFFTRWITFLCAPVFVFLAGTSIFLQQQRKSKPELARFLLTRGLWLIIVELTLVHLVFYFNWQWNVQLLEVIWAIGASMIAMAALLRLGARGNAIIGALIVCGHNDFDSITPAAFGKLAPLWMLLHVPGFLTGPPTKPPIVLVAYPVLPWLGVMALGYAFGAILQRSPEQQQRFAFRTGSIFLAAFALLRFSNLYGDPSKWHSRGTALKTSFDFFAITKYPPSLLFVLATLGISALVFFVIEKAEAANRFATARSVLQVYGRVPLFFFLLHIALVHLFALGLSAATGGNWRWWISEFPQGSVLAGIPPGYGYGLGVIWSIWLLVVVLCYPICKWYARVKAASRNPLLSYL